MGLLKEFRDFALRGNVVDMAVGVIVGGAFGGIVKSLIDDMIMPVVGIAAKADFSNLYIPLNEKVTKDVATAMANYGTALSLVEVRKLGPVLAWGNFVTIVMNFVILASCVFLVVKAMNVAKQRFEKEQLAKPPEPPADVKLLTEIRDLLKGRTVP